MSGSRGLVEDARLGWRVRLLLGCYPPWWRVRYDDEMRDTVLALRDEGRWTATGSRDLLRGLVAAWVNPAGVADDEGMSAGERRLLPFAAWGLLLFVLGGAGFAKTLEYPEFTSAADRHPLLAWSVDLLAVVAVCTAVVMAAAALVALASVMPRRSARLRVARPLVGVPVGLAAFAVALMVARGIASGSAPAHDRQLVTFLVLVTVTVICGGVCTVALMRAAARVPESRAFAIAAGSLCCRTTTSRLDGRPRRAGLDSGPGGEYPSLLREHEGLVSTPRS